MISKRRFHLALAIITALAVFSEGVAPCFSVCQAGDWPQLLGPNRDGQALQESTLKTDWKSEPPQVLWSEPTSSGYAGVAIQSGVAYLFERADKTEQLRALDLKTGKRNWLAEWPASYRSSMDPDSGPRAVPVLSQGLAVCYGAAGDLVCIDLSSGKTRWNKALRKQFDADDGYFGAGCSPIVIGETVIVNIGGKKAGIVGVDLKTGKINWTATSYDASYASPIEVQVDGKPACLVVTRLKTVHLNPQDGKVLSEIDFGARGPTVNAATPLALGNNQYFFTANYGIGAKLVQVSSGKLQVSYSDRELLASQYNSPVKIGNVVIGVNGREDAGSSTLRVLDPISRKTLTEKNLPGTTHLIAVGKQLLMLSVNGTLQLGQVTESGNDITILGQYDVAKSASGAYRALPALSDHVLVVRSSDGGQGGKLTALAVP